MDRDRSLRLEGPRPGVRQGVRRGRPRRGRGLPGPPFQGDLGLIVRRRVRVRGRVQGVFFRATCAREARSLGVRGWVRNDADGAVEAVFEGEDAAVESMTAWCRHGPAGARVDDVEVVSEVPEGLGGFAVTG